MPAWLLLCLALTTGTSAGAAPLVEVPSFGSNPGNLRMFVLVPDNLPPDAALVVVAHGCLQTAQEIADISGWSDIAVAQKFAVVYPQTSRDNDSFAGCFRTWLPEHQSRDQGEPQSVVQMVRWMLEHYPLDAHRVFITGLSSGGHLTNVMLATYPDVFAAGAPQSSFPYKCAVSLADVDACCRGVARHTRKEWGDLARSAYPQYHGVRPRVSIWHGKDDPLLLVSNLDDQMEQWTEVLGIDDVPDALKHADGYTGLVYQDGSHTALVETFTIPGLGHAVAIDPDAAVKCGQAGQYSADTNICAARWIARWFGIAE